MNQRAVRNFQQQNPTSRCAVRAVAVPFQGVERPRFSWRGFLLALFVGGRR